MLLVKDDELLALATHEHSLLKEAIEGWRDRGPSMFLHHGDRCCALAREWLFATDFSRLNGESLLTGPRWLRARYDWGPSSWPMFWCDAVKQKTLDCGAHSTLAKEIFAHRGISAHPVQLIQQYTKNTTAHWLAKWEGKAVASDWIYGDLVYHEACAVETAAGAIGIWDPSMGTWLDPQTTSGFGAVIALRLCSSIALPVVRWGQTKVCLNEWQPLGAGMTTIATASSHEAEPAQLITLLSADDAQPILSGA
jgi:hypothetical protein